ncbi:hypothetical protein [Burkholderia sp. Ac-20344]|uniref:hypothetical protein n=1 Tax=Burkholderia sp. Ac-20344 TaxID=2703890 RepID=UPI00197C3C4F|nr:hypothetical protein [Burkholderia sp. Ac-20344]MBN3834923.1 hypothetical protein [Burkholderia sp. Ac-20344]
MARPISDDNGACRAGASFRETFRYPDNARQSVASGACNTRKKKKRLPKALDRLFDEEDLAALQAVFDICDVNARGGPGEWAA